MKRKKLEELRRELIRCRASQQKPRDLEAIAKRLGRKKQKGKNTKHPMWVSQEFDYLRPLSIPHHGGKDLPGGTRNSILDQLEEDVLAWEQQLHEEEN